VGGLKNGAVSFDGKEYHMGRHGFARNQEFTLSSQSRDEIVLDLRDNADTLAQYPFHFSFQIRHKLLENGFSTQFKVKNTDQKTLPFCVGGHTAFRCPLLPGQRFEDYHLVFEQEEDSLSPLLNAEGCVSQNTERFLSGSNTLDLDYDLFRRVDTVMFRGLRSKTVSLLHKETGRGVRMEFAQFPMVAFWTKPGAPYLCLEPWHGCAASETESGEFKDKPHCVQLLPGEEKTLEYTVTLISG
jgi:galactose mutarotase-like enzyme